MKYLKIASSFMIVCSLLIAFSHKRKNKFEKRIKLHLNNLSKELEAIDDSLLNSDETDINSLLNKHGFLKTKYDTLNENDKFNYSLIHDYL
jgi:hypothetical protein